MEIEVKNLSCSEYKDKLQRLVDEFKPRCDWRWLSVMRTFFCGGNVRCTDGAVPSPRRFGAANDGQMSVVEIMKQVPEISTVFKE
jgi:hypothetical protein